MLDRQGRFAEAATAYRRVLAVEPRNADVLHSLGVALAKMGLPQDAVGCLAAAVQIQPRNFAWQINLGSALSALGRHPEAVACYERASALKPDLAAAHRGRGLALLRIGRFEDAASSLERALRLAPDDANAHADLGVAFERVGRRQEALRCLRRATQLNAHHADAHHNLGLIEASLGNFTAALASLDRTLALQPNRPAVDADRGNVLLSLGRPAEAVASYDRAIAIAPELFDTHFYRGLALLQLERLEECIAAFDRALTLNPDAAEAHNNRGVALARLDRPDAALESFKSALRCKPDHAESHTNAGNTLKGLKRYEEALRSFDHALSIRPDEPMTVWSKALLQLSRGDFREGWPLYEARFRLAHLAPLQRRFDIPRWSSRDPLEGKSLLVYAEQGLGDTLQFCRYIPLLEARGAHVAFEVQASLKNLLRSLDMRGALIARGEPLPQVDFACPLLSLPLEFGTGMDDIPDGVPYVSADGAAVDAWKSRLTALPGLKIGLNWQGNPETEKQPWVRGRSFALREAARLASLPGVSLVSLQKGEGAQQREHVAFKSKLAQLSDPSDLGPGAFGDTAALVKALDLVITSDTSVAHLAGALGAPVWVVLQFEPDWRWLTSRDDNPWYPTMRLFRQQRPGDWSEVFDRVAQAVLAWAADPARTQG